MPRTHKQRLAHGPACELLPHPARVPAPLPPRAGHPEADLPGDLAEGHGPSWESAWIDLGGEG